MRYFNPRSREGSDPGSAAAWPPGCRFQSTLPRGERHDDPSEVERLVSISIHAPARGATRPIRPAHRPGPFQSTLPRGERLYRSLPSEMIVRFQSTLPRGERLHPGDILDPLPKISIHAPARGATLPDFPPGQYKINFNPRSREGSDFVQDEAIAAL